MIYDKIYVNSVFYHTILYYTILYYTILYYTTLYYTILYMYIVYAPQYLTRGDIKTIREYLEAHSYKSIDNEELKYHQKKRFYYWDEVRYSIF